MLIISKHQQSILDSYGNVQEDTKTIWNTAQEGSLNHS